MYRAVLATIALVLTAGVASAQITTYVAPSKPKPTPQMVATADSARADSAAAVAMTNMKTWVDSAAGVTVPRHVGDSTVPDPGAPGVPPVAVTTFENGSVAPNTASALPTLGVIGLVALVAGAALLGGRPRG